MKKSKLTDLDKQALKQIDEQRTFQSPTYGAVSFKEVIFKIGMFMKTRPQDNYEVIIGTDSQVYKQDVVFVSAIIIHRIGGGALYFWEKERNTDGFWVLKTRMYEEAVRSMVLAQKFMEEYRIEGITRFNTEIHVDIGGNGKTKELITEVVGMIQSSGFAVKTKPQSFGATSVADRHT